MTFSTFFSLWTHRRCFNNSEIVYCVNIWLVSHLFYCERSSCIALISTKRNNCFFLSTNILLNAIRRVFVNGEHLLFHNSEPYWYIFLIRFSECEIRFTGPLISLTWIFFFNPCIRCVRNTIFFLQWNCYF